MTMAKTTRKKVFIGSKSSIYGDVLILNLFRVILERYNTQAQKLNNSVIHLKKKLGMKLKQMMP